MKNIIFKIIAKFTKKEAYNPLFYVKNQAFLLYIDNQLYKILYYFKALFISELHYKLLSVEKKKNSASITLADTLLIDLT